MKVIAWFDKLHSWYKHAIVAFAVGLFTRMGLWIFGWQVDLTVMAMLVWALLTTVNELNQKDNHPATYDYKDGIGDMIFGNVYFWIPLLLGNPIFKALFK